MQPCVHAYHQAHVHPPINIKSSTQALVDVHAKVLISIIVIVVVADDLAVKCIWKGALWTVD